MAELRNFIICNLLFILAFITVTEACEPYLFVLQALLVIIRLYSLSMRSGNKLPLIPQLFCYFCCIASCVGFIYLHNRLLQLNRNICKVLLPDLPSFIATNGHRYNWMMENIMNGKYEEILDSGKELMNKILSSWLFINVASHTLITLTIMVAFHYFIYDKSSVSTLRKKQQANDLDQESHDGPTYSPTKHQKHSPVIQTRKKSLITAATVGIAKLANNNKLEDQNWYHGHVSDELAVVHLKGGACEDGSYLVYDDSESTVNYILLAMKDGHIWKWYIVGTHDRMYRLGIVCTRIDDDIEPEVPSEDADNPKAAAVPMKLKHHKRQNSLPDAMAMAILGSKSKIMEKSISLVKKQAQPKSLLDREWYHGKITLKEAETRLKRGAKNIDGSYLVSDHPESENDYVLQVYNKGKILRWKITKSFSDDTYVLGDDTPQNRLRYDSVITLIKNHRGATGQGLRLPDNTVLTLSKSYVAVKECNAEKEEEEEVNSDNDEAKDRAGKKSEKVDLSDRKWYHGSISRQVAEDRLKEGAGDIDGSYLVYDHPNEPGNYVLLINFKADMLRWKISKRAVDGKYILGEDVETNKKPVYNDVVDLIKFHRGIMGTPVMLENRDLVTLSKSYVTNVALTEDSEEDGAEEIPKKLVRSNSMSRIPDRKELSSSGLGVSQRRRPPPPPAHGKKISKETKESAAGQPKYKSVVDLIKNHRGRNGKPIITGDGKPVVLRKPSFFSPEQ